MFREEGWLRASINDEEKKMCACVCKAKEEEKWENRSLDDAVGSVIKTNVLTREKGFLVDISFSRTAGT